MTFGKDRCGLISSQIIQTKNSILYPQLLNLPVYKNKFIYFKKEKCLYFRNPKKDVEQICALEFNVLYFLKDI